VFELTFGLSVCRRAKGFVPKSILRVTLKPGIRVVNLEHFLRFRALFRSLHLGFLICLVPEMFHVQQSTPIYHHLFSPILVEDNAHRLEVHNDFVF